FEDILAVLDTGSFHAAAEVRFLTPSAFTRRVKSIEDSLGCILFDRSKKPIVLHQHALDLVPDIREAVGVLKGLKLSLSDPYRDTRHRITIISQHTLTATWAPEIVNFLSKSHDISVRVKSGNKSTCLLELIKRQADFALTYEDASEGPSIDAVYGDRILLGSETFLAVAQLRDNPDLRAELDQRHIPLIGYPTSIFLGEVQKRVILSEAAPDLTFSTVAEAGLGLAVAEFVRRGLGVGWLPKALLRNELASGRLEDLSHILPAFSLQVVLQRLKATQKPLALELWELVDGNMWQSKDEAPIEIVHPWQNTAIGDNP
ncbi:MAG: LysR family transcriptional regulator, partial [Sulfitobacter sp.]